MSRSNHWFWIWVEWDNFSDAYISCPWIYNNINTWPRIDHWTGLNLKIINLIPDSMCLICSLIHNLIIVWRLLWWKIKMTKLIIVRHNWTPELCKKMRRNNIHVLHVYMITHHAVNYNNDLFNFHREIFSILSAIIISYWTR